MPNPESPPQKNRLRTWLFRLAAGTLVPTALLAATEFSLRLAGYGHPTGFLVPDPTHPAIANGNEHFGLRFFPEHLSRSPRPLHTTYQKPDGTLRVVVLGGSAAMGDPDPAIGLPRMLQAVLEKRLPDKNIEVINAAMTAINSHAVQAIARDCTALDPDAFVVYMGNNEVLGPFGANTIFGDATPPATTVRANLALRSTRLGQLLHNLTSSPPPTAKSSWRGMAMFLDQQVDLGSSSLETVRTNFLANLGSIARTGTPVVLSTVASNLRDSPPFAGAAANTGFANATGLLNENKTTAASNAFTLARDLDSLRFRTDTKLNATITTFAADNDLPLVDTVQLAAKNSPHGIPGRELFYEHVHLTPT
ncbi:MAG: hypothetical protein P8J87_05110, partial [Verrucomicrobiales bacterium]|nr:hypothetical protein [Verrucomicrobiales bacterium]